MTTMHAIATNRAADFKGLKIGVPAKVFLDCGVDFDRWYPFPRRMAATARFMLTHRRDRDHLRHILDTVGERFDVRCGPFPALSTVRGAQERVA